jgi:PIN domain nuclease of toxin-antitoxin system
MIVLDTHIVIWLLGDTGRISQRAQRAIRALTRRSQQPAISCQSFYEISRGIVRGRMRVTPPLPVFLRGIEARFQVVPLTSQIATIAAEFSPAFPGDPFDRIIAATAVAQGAPLITADKRILRSDEVETIW